MSVRRVDFAAVYVLFAVMINALLPLPRDQAILDPRNNTIFSVCDGTFYVSTEKISPDLNHEVAEKYYTARMGQQIHKRFVNVIPDKPSLKFRLIDLV